MACFGRCPKASVGYSRRARHDLRVQVRIERHAMKAEHNKSSNDGHKTTQKHNKRERNQWVLPDVVACNAVMLNAKLVILKPWNWASLVKTMQ